ncbi:MAG TPA: hypothetical protein VHP83_23515 [Aggregatilineaceae bacterium]|nr:hypothetical protein [Aggregatilineaceae bacterium]
MLIVAGLSAAVLAVVLAVILRRALYYLVLHPELKTAVDSPPLSYQRCQMTLQHVILRYQQIEQQLLSSASITWQSPRGFFYVVNGAGVQQHHDPLVYRLSWDEIGGVGVRMQPGFKFLDHDHDGSVDQTQTTGYSFHILIVPVSGSTIDIQIPTGGQPDAVDFVAHTIAFARRKDRRINVFGFNKPPLPARQRITRRH